jgi:threonine dehydrogenase-like Zn-dependent dehydrogenase
VIGAAVVPAGFVALAVVLLARLFGARLVAQDQMPGIRLLIERMRPEREA